MNCDQVRELLEAYVLDALDADEWAAVEHHLLDCPDCRREADELVEVVNMLPDGLAEASSLHPPASLKTQLVKAVESQPKTIQPVLENDSEVVDELVNPTLAASTLEIDGKPNQNRLDKTEAGSWLRPRTVAVLAILLILVLSIAWGARFGLALAQERAMLRSELANLIDQQEVVLEVVDANEAVRRVLLPPERNPDAIAPPYGKIFNRPDLPHVVAMIARLPQPPAGQAYHLWLTGKGQTQLAGVMNVNDDGFSLLVFDDETATYDSAQLTLQPEGSTAPAGDPILVWTAAE